MNEEMKNKEVKEVKTEETPEVNGEEPADVPAVTTPVVVDKKAAKAAAKVEAKVKKNLRNAEILTLENEVLMHPENQEAQTKLATLKSERNKDRLKTGAKIGAAVGAATGLAIGVFKLVAGKNNSGDDSVTDTTFEEVNTSSEE